jgi:U3 small nucleolar RNA-associated protein 14
MSSQLKYDLNFVNLFEEQEKSLLKDLNPKELKAKINEMSKLKLLLFQNERKNKRIGKIKSKLYHKIRKKV